VDTTRNLIYVSAIDEGRISIIDGATDRQIGSLHIKRGDGETVPLRNVVVNPNVGPEGHLLLTTSSEDGGQDQFLLIPNGWPTLGTPVPLDIASYPLEGLALDPTTDRAWVTSVGSGLVSVVQDGLPVCLTPFDVGGGDVFQIEVFETP
jgi:DNA-binding beta-propeller fold protein YncE